jgi:hypothetical protein
VGTEEWVDAEHLRALGRVVVAATWMETVLDHVVRGLVDDGPVYAEMVAGQSVSQLCGLAPRLAARVVDDPDAVSALRTWVQQVRTVAEERNGLFHAGHFKSEDDPRERMLIIGKRAKRSMPPIEISATVSDVLGLADRIDDVSSEGLELMERLAAGYRGRSAPRDPAAGSPSGRWHASTVEESADEASHTE